MTDQRVKVTVSYELNGKMMLDSFRLLPNWTNAVLKKAIRNKAYDDGVLASDQKARIAIRSVLVV